MRIPTGSLLAITVLAGCRSTEPGPEPLPEPKGTMAIHHSDHGVLLRDVVSGLDTVVIPVDSRLPFLSTTILGLPGRNSFLAPYHLRLYRTDLVEVSLIDGSMIHHIAGEDHQAVYAADRSVDGRRVLVYSSLPQMIREVDLATGVTTVWWQGRADFNDTVAVSSPRYDPVTGGILLKYRADQADWENVVLASIGAPGGAVQVVIPRGPGVSFIDNCYWDVDPTSGDIIYRSDGELRLHRRPGSTRRYTLPAGLMGSCIRFSPDGEFLVYRRDGVNWIYRFRDGRITALPTSLSPDGVVLDWW